MSSLEPLSSIETKLDELEATVAQLLRKPDPLPEDRHHGTRTDVLELLATFHDAEPGIWVPMAQLATYRHERLRYRQIQEHLGWLVEHRHVQRLTVGQPHSAGRMVLLRLHTDADHLYPAPVIMRVNAELGVLGHRIEIHPARPTLSHFHRREITTEHGTFTCYRRWHFWEPRLERIEPKGN